MRNDPYPPETKKKIIIIGSVLGALFLLGLVGAIVGMSIKHVDTAEIKSWDFRENLKKNECPKMLRSTITVYDELPMDFKGEARKGYGMWNALSSELKFRRFFISESQRKLLLAASGAGAAGNRYVYVREAPKDAKECKALKLTAGLSANERQVTQVSHAFAWVQRRKDLQGAVIFVCLEKFKNAIKLQQTPAAHIARRVGLSGILAHEFGHLILGEGHTSKKYGAILTEQLKHAYISAHEKALVRERIVRVCK